ncbi:MAG: phytase [Planctomycetota bacterium JB042]
MRLVAALCLALAGEEADVQAPVRPILVTDPVIDDSDDPAIWIDRADPSRSLLLGTDKGGRLFAFDLAGKRREDLTVEGLARPNNVDVEYDLRLDGGTVDVAVVTERDGGRMRVFRLPDLAPLDGGGIAVFAGEPDRRPMGVALYRRPSDGAVFAILSRKVGPTDALLWQYRLEDDGDGKIRAVVVRRFGSWSGPAHPTIEGEGNEVEAVCVDDELGEVYYSEEAVGVHKWAADPDAPDADLERARFGTDGFEEDREGISLYPFGPEGGVLLVSDQAAGRFHVFSRRPPHARLAVVPLSTVESDGSDATAIPLGPRFPRGLFVAMSDDRTFQVYDWRDVRARWSSDDRR